MVSPAEEHRRKAEAERLDLVFAYVLTQIGASSIEEALSVWQDVPPSQTQATINAWVEGATRAIKMQRGRARSLGIAYYRLARALRTGRTIPDPLLDEPEPESVSLEGLRSAFDALLDESLTEPVSGPEIEPERLEAMQDAFDEVDVDDPLGSMDPIDEDDAILLEEIAGLEDAMANELAAEDDYLEVVMQEMGADLLDSKVNAIDPEVTNNEAAQEARRLHTQVGSQVAAAGARVAMNGARGFVEKASRKDNRVIGWIRQSSTGTPCYFCAMLIGRGVLYKSKAIAERRGGLYDPMDADANKYHDNCYCYAVPVYSMDQFNDSENYAMNRHYGALWKEHIADKYPGGDSTYRGTPAIRAWRKLLRSLETQAAQEAA